MILENDGLPIRFFINSTPNVIRKNSNEKIENVICFPASL